MGKNVGWVAIWREFREHPLWREPREFSKAEAWISMIMEANWTEGTDFAGQPVPRGSFITSNTRLAKDWNWTRDRVRRFLKALENEKQVAQQTRGSALCICVVNYEDYQRVVTDAAFETRTKRAPKRAQHNKQQDLSLSVVANPPPVDAQILGACGNVRLTTAEVDRMIADFGADRTRLTIEWFDSWQAETTDGSRVRKYATMDHNRVMRRWVFDAAQNNPDQYATSAPRPNFKSRYEEKRERKSQVVSDFVSAPDLVPPTRRLGR